MSTLIIEIMALHGALRDHGERLTAPTGQTPARWQLLGAAQGRPLTVSQISRRMGLVRQSVQRVANILVKEGLATFESNRDHARSPLFVLTADGQRTVAEINELQRRWSNTIGSQLKLGDLESTLDTLRTLRSVLDEAAHDEVLFKEDGVESRSGGRSESGYS